MQPTYRLVVTDARETFAQPPMARDDALEEFDIVGLLPEFVGARLRVVTGQEWQAIQATAARRQR